MIFHNRQGFWHRRGIESLEESKGEDEGLQKLRDERRTSLEAQASSSSGSEMHDAPPSEEEGRQ